MYFRRFVALSLFSLLVNAGAVLAADDSPPAAKPKLADGKLGESWTDVFVQHQKLAARLTELQQNFRKAKTNDEQDAMRKEFTEKRTEFQSVDDRLAELAPKVFAADPKNFDAGEAVMEAALQGHRFDDSKQIAQTLIAAGRRNVLTVNVLGVSQFATHDFTGAVATFTAAEKEEMMHPQLGGRYQDAASEYVAFWKEEQAVRKAEAAATGEAQLPRVLFKTNRGDIVLELFENEAPNTVASFVSLVEGKKYDGVKFHRVIPMFMAQGGDPNSLDDDPSNDGLGGPGYMIKCECFAKNARRHFRGSLSMAKTAAPNTGGSQFFLTHLPTPHLNANVDAQSGHTVFGRIVEGLDVAASLKKDDKIETATVVRKRKHEYKPETLPDGK